MDDTVHYLGRSSIGLSSPIRPTVFQDATHEEVHTALTLETLAGTYGGALPTPESPVGDLDRRKRQELARIHGVWGRSRQPQPAPIDRGRIYVPLKERGKGFL